MKKVKPAQFLSIIFLIGIAVGTLLLKLPWASQSLALSWVDSFFTATSAVCVTGLTVVHIGADLSIFGQIVVLVLIQIGALGYMTLATAIIFFGTLNLKERLMIQETMHHFSLEGLKRFTQRVFLATVIFECFGALILTACFWDSSHQLQSVYRGIFHSVSAFCNAGFGLFSRSIEHTADKPLILMTVALLSIMGGLGFIVLRELLSFGKTKKLSTHSKIVLCTTGMLIIGATCLVWLSEKDNPLTLGMLSHSQQWMCALFQAVTPRTMGFSVLPVRHMVDFTLLLTIALMFIGASPGGTGGGIKTTTFAVMLATIRSTLLGKKDVEIFKRRLSLYTIKKSFVLITISLVIIFSVTLLLLFIEQMPLRDVLFETFSAFSTVGLSTGITSRFSDVAKLIICCTMFIGRLGPLTIGLAALKQSGGYYRYPEEEIPLG